MNNHNEFIAKIVFIDDIAKDTKKIRFRIMDDDFGKFQEGQFFLMEVEKNVFRPYSVASTSTVLPIFDLIIKYVKGGKASEFLWHTADIGTEISFKGPMGRFSMDSENNRDKIFIATGTGLAPMRSFWQFIKENNFFVGVKLFFGVRNIENIFCQEELVNIKNKFPEKFDYQICISQPEKDVDFDFFTGRVTDCLSVIPNKEFANNDIFICGNHNMSNEVKQILSDKGIDKSCIKTESW